MLSKIYSGNQYTYATTAAPRPSRHFEEEPSRKLDGFFLTKLEQRLDSSNRNSLSHPATLKKNRPESWTVFSYQTQTAVWFFKPQFFII